MVAELAIALTIGSHFAGKPVTLTCVDFGRNDPTLGEVNAGDSDIDLANRVCRSLRRPARTEAFAEAVLVVIHEALHARGDTNEQRVECRASRRTPIALYRWYGMRDTRALVRRVSLTPECV